MVPSKHMVRLCSDWNSFFCAFARADAGLGGTFRLDSPATVERIRMSCVDHLTQKASGVP